MAKTAKELKHEILENWRKHGSTNINSSLLKHLHHITELIVSTDEAHNYGADKIDWSTLMDNTLGYRGNLAIVIDRISEATFGKYNPDFEALAKEAIRLEKEIKAENEKITSEISFEDFASAVIPEDVSKIAEEKDKIAKKSEAKNKMLTDKVAELKKANDELTSLYNREKNELSQLEQKYRDLQETTEKIKRENTSLDYVTVKVVSPIYFFGDDGQTYDLKNGDITKMPKRNADFYFASKQVIPYVSPVPVEVNLPVTSEVEKARNLWSQYRIMMTKNKRLEADGILRQLKQLRPKIFI